MKKLLSVVLFIVLIGSVGCGNRCKQINEQIIKPTNWSAHELFKVVNSTKNQVCYYTQMGIREAVIEMQLQAGAKYCRKVGSGVKCDFSNVDKDMTEILSLAAKINFYNDEISKNCSHGIMPFSVFSNKEKAQELLNYHNEILKPEGKKLYEKYCTTYMISE